MATKYTSLWIRLHARNASRSRTSQSPPVTLSTNFIHVVVRQSFPGPLTSSVQKHQYNPFTSRPSDCRYFTVPCAKVCLLKSVLSRMYSVALYITVTEKHVLFDSPPHIPCPWPFRPDQGVSIIRLQTR